MGQGKRLIIVALVVFACGARGLFAQNGLRDRERAFSASQEIANDLRRAHFHHGAFYLLNTFQLSDIGYDSSFYVPTADKQSGFRFGIQVPTRLYIVPRKKTIYSFDVRPEWSFFSRSGQRVVFGYKARADAQYLLNHLYLDFYAQTANQLRADVGEIARLLTEKAGSAGVSGELKYSSRTSMTFNASTGKSSHPLDKIQPSAPVQLLDRSEHNYRLTVHHKTFPLTSLFLATEYSDYSFTDAVFKNGSRSYTGLGFVHDSGRTVTRGEAGMGKLDFIRPGEHDFQGALGNLSSTKKFGKSTAGTLTASRDVDFSIFAFNNYYIADRVSGLWSWEATRRLTINLQAAYGRDLYETPVAGPHGFLKRKDVFTFPSIGFTYGFARLRGGADIGYVRRTSNFDVNVDSGIRILYRLSFTP
ncbi:MAG: putative beta-barrel porin 2 [Thermoanaerobaculia bacterium]|nr:putative beta-barrel porin 2 [Thermoanaerobaculia bacterium]